MLVKKPESIEELQNSIPRAPLSQPSKPEVYFIKYKAQTAGGFSVPAPIGLSAPSAGGQSADFGAADFGSTSSAAAAAASVVTSSHSSGGSHDASLR